MFSNLKQTVSVGMSAPGKCKGFYDFVASK